MSYTFKPEHGVSLAAFKKLATCATEPLHNGRELIPACVSSWAVWEPLPENSETKKDGMGWDLVWQKAVGGACTLDAIEKLTKEEFGKIKDELLSNVVFIALNASARAGGRVWQPYEFFHTGSEDGKGNDFRFRKMFHEWKLPFEGAYITDIIKVKDTERNMFIETKSPDVAKQARKPGFRPALELNFEILLNELETLRGDDNEELMLLIPLGGAAREQLDEFFAWLGDKKKPLYTKPKGHEIYHYAFISDDETNWAPLKEVEKDFAREQRAYLARK